MINKETLLKNKGDRCIVLGNGESRLGLDVGWLSERATIYAANRAYEDDDVKPIDRLVCVDIAMSHEIYASGYPLHNTTYFREWSRLPAEAYDFVVRPEHISRQDIGQFSKWVHESPRHNGWNEFVIAGQDFDRMVTIREEYLTKWPNARPEDIDIVLGDNRAGLWITWCPPEDKVIEGNVLPGNADYGFAAGPTMNVLASVYDKAKEVYLVGHDLYSKRGDFVNNVYKGTPNYLAATGSEVPPDTWIPHHKLIFDKFPNTQYFTVNSKPISTYDRINREIKGWNNTPNLTYITHDEMFERLNH